MKKIAKIIAVLIMLGVVLLIIGTIALHIFLPPEKAKALVLKQLTTHLKRDVKVESVSVGVLTGLVVNKLKISELPNFSNGTFISSDKFSIRLSFMPLLSRKIEVSQLILDRPDIQIIRHADGKTFNFSDLISTAPAKTSETSSSDEHYAFVPEAYAAGPGEASSSSSESSLQLLVSNAQIRDGVIHFVDRSPAKQNADITSLEVKLKNVSLTAPFPAQVSLKVKAMGADVAIQLMSNVDLAADMLKIDSLSLSLGSIQVTGHGEVHGMSSAQPSANLHVESNAFAATEALKYAPPGALPPKLDIKGNMQISADVSGTAASCHLAAKWEGKDLEIHWPDLFVKAAGVPLDVSLIGEQLDAGKTINLPTVKAVLSTFQLTGSAAYRTVGKFGQMAIAMKTNSLALGDVAGLVPTLAVYKPVGTAALEVRASGSLTSPVANGTLTLKNVGAHYQQSELTALSGDFTFTQQDVETPKLTGKLNGADFTIKLAAHKIQTQPDISIDANLAELDLDKVLPPAVSAAPHAWLPIFIPEAFAAGPAAVFPPMKVAAHLVVGHIKQELYDGKNLDFKCNLTGITEDLAGVNGTAALRQGSGQIQNLTKLADRSKAVHIALLPILTLQKLQSSGALGSLGLPSLDNIAFDSIRGDYVIQLGMMTIQTFDLTGHALSIQTNGTVGLAGAQPINMKVTTQLAPGAGGAIGQWTQDASGRPTVKFNVTGSVANPSVKVDVQDLGKKALQQIGGQLLNGNPADQLQKAFKGLFH